jgi:tetrahydrodipicolinate N-succinyltransferase
VGSNSQLGEGIVIGAGCQVAPGQCLGQADKIIRV